MNKSTELLAPVSSTVFVYVDGADRRLIPMESGR
jgi:hypothetical protein